MTYSICNSCEFYSPVIGCCASFREAYDVCPFFDEDDEMNVCSMCLECSNFDLPSGAVRCSVGHDCFMEFDFCPDFRGGCS